MRYQQVVGLPGDEEGDNLSRLGCITVVDNGDLVTSFFSSKKFRFFTLELPHKFVMVDKGDLVTLFIFLQTNVHQKTYQH